MTPWLEFALAWLVFMLSHFLPSLGLRDRMIGGIGRRAYFAGYGVVSILSLGWLIGAAARAPFVELWPPEHWTRWMPILAMPVAVFLGACAIGNRYPFSLGGRRAKAFDRASPGLAAVSRHPLPLALVIWSIAHLPPNGDLAHIVLFGSFAALGLAAIPLFDNRARRALSADDAAALFRSAPVLSLAILADAARRRANAAPLWWRMAWSIATVLLILGVHKHVVGVSALP